MKLSIFLKKKSKFLAVAWCTLDGILSLRAGRVTKTRSTGSINAIPTQSSACFLLTRNKFSSIFILYGTRENTFSRNPPARDSVQEFYCHNAREIHPARISSCSGHFLRQGGRDSIYDRRFISVHTTAQRRNEPVLEMILRFSLLKRSLTHWQSVASFQEYNLFLLNNIYCIVHAA